MDALLIGHALRRLVCWIFAHDYVISVPAKALVNVWCQRCGDPFPTKL
jgi:hypothetical protein